MPRFAVNLPFRGESHQTKLVVGQVYLAKHVGNIFRYPRGVPRPINGVEGRKMAVFVNFLSSRGIKSNEKILFLTIFTFRSNSLVQRKITSNQVSYRSS